jgi:glycosyltransferase 2 family protein
VGDGTATLQRAVDTFTLLLDQLWVFLLLAGVTLTALRLDVVPAATGLIGTGALIVPTLAMAGWVALLGYGLFAHAGRLESMLGRLLRSPRLARFRDRMLAEARALHTRLQTLRTRPARFHIIAFTIMGGTWVARFLVLLFVVASMTTAFDPGPVLLRGVAMTVLGLFVPTPGGAGGVEAMYALFFDALLPAALLAPTLVVWRFLVQYVFIAGGAYLWLHTVRARRKLITPAPSHVSAEIRS